MIALVTRGDTEEPKTAAERLLPTFSLAPLIGSGAGDAFLYWFLVLVGIAATVSALGFLEARRRKLTRETKRRYAIFFLRGEKRRLIGRNRKHVTEA